MSRRIGPVGRSPVLPLHVVADGVGERHGGVAEVVRAAEAHEARARRDEAAAEQRRQLVEVEVGERERGGVNSLGADAREAAVADRALVERSWRSALTAAAPKPLADPQRADDAVLVEAPAPVGAAEVRAVAPADLARARACAA